MNYVSLHSQNDIKKMNYNSYIEIAQSISALSFEGVYLVELTSNKLIFVSSHPILLCGMNEHEIKDKGLDALLNNVSKEDLSLTFDMVNTIKKSYKHIPLEYKKKLVVSTIIHIRHNNKYCAVNHKYTTLCFDNNGIPKLLLGMASPVVPKTGSSITASVYGTNLHFRYNPDNKDWEPINVPCFSDDEILMLRMSMSGLSIIDISKRMFKSIDTIRFYRRQVFDKCNVNNINEAIAYCLHLGIL